MMNEEKDPEQIDLLINSIKEGYIQLYPANGDEEISIYKDYAMKKKNVTQLSIEKKFDKATIYRKIDKVRKYIESLGAETEEVKEIEMQNLSLMMPAEFALGKKICNDDMLSLVGYKVFWLTIALFQNHELDYITRNQYIKISPALKNKKQLVKLAKELECLTIESKHLKIKIYDKIHLENCKLYFAFTFETIVLIGMFH